ncbi:CcmD family protein [Dehalococcoidia bacterium]|nr:CcmD family protein [Dehalococcoidia bacterium]
MAAAAVAVWALATGVTSAAVQNQSHSKLYDESPLPYLLVVYTVSWLAFFAYAFYMTRRQHELSREIDELRRALEK